MRSLVTQAPPFSRALGRARIPRLVSRAGVAGPTSAHCALLSTTRQSAGKKSPLASSSPASSSSPDASSAPPPARSYNHTVTLPKTLFPLRADASRRESLFRARTTTQLYTRQWDRWLKRSNPLPVRAKDVFVLHDGPPYANGDLHMGHALNKILKDIINRYQLLAGRTVHYVPGWDCHGLPIELKALTELGVRHVQEQQAQQTRARKAAASDSSFESSESGFGPRAGVTVDRAQVKALKAASKGDKQAQAKLAQAAAAVMDPLAIRTAAREKAAAAVAAQRKQFEDLGIMGGWDLGSGAPSASNSEATKAGRAVPTNVLRQGGGVYRTLDPAYEGAQLEVFARMVDHGLVYRAERPTYWSPSSGTALAEAELEYTDRPAQAAYVRFPLHTLTTEMKDALVNVPLAPEGAEAVRHILKAPPAQGSNLVVWTTTPWTLPANMAVAVHPDLEYALVRSPSGALDWIATDRLDEVGTLVAAPTSGEIQGEAHDKEKPAEPEILLVLPGHKLLGCSYTHPFLRPETATAGPGQACIVPATWVSATSGTGLVHCAPAHGAEDYELLRSRGIAGPGLERELFSPVNAEGRYDSSLALDPPTTTGTGMETSTLDLVGLDVLTDGNKTILEKLGAAPAARLGLSDVPATTEPKPAVPILVHTHAFEHREPTDWRTGGPVLTRATTQWFTDLGPLQDTALAAIGEPELPSQQSTSSHEKVAAQQGQRTVRCIPPAGQSRLRAHVRGRAEWCISRQRAWGVPIPVVYAPDGMPILTGANVRHIATILRERGADSWWTDPAEDFVLPELKSKYISDSGPGQSHGSWTTGRDTLDVWFDSGSSWAHLQTNLLLPLGEEVAARQPVADVYLEGSDQHRGWFQSALLTSVAASSASPSSSIEAAEASAAATSERGSDGNWHGRAAAPYGTLITHGMVVDPSGRKMSKSVGNVLAPQTVLQGGRAPDGQIPPLGADVLRFWAARTDTSRDAPVGKAILDQAADGLRRLRNVTRFLLSNLRGHTGHEPFPQFGERQVQSPPPARVLASFQVSEHLLLSQLHTAMADMKASYDAYDFSSAARRLSDLAIGPLSGLYLDSAKDALYTDPLNGSRREAIISVLEIAFRSLLSALAPIAPHLAEEAWEFRRRETNGYLGLPSVPEDASEGDSRIQGSVFDLGWQEVPDVWDRTKAQQGEHLLGLRTALLATLESARSKDLIGSALEADVSFIAGDRADTKLLEALVENQFDLARLMNVSRVFLPHITPSPVSTTGSAVRAADTVPVVSEPSWTVIGEHNGIQIRLSPPALSKCPRCWSYTRHEEHELCPRCDEVVKPQTGQQTVP